MAHEHDTCPRCIGGVLYEQCSSEYCYDEGCTEVGHCECLCHSGKSCPCGRHSWPKVQ